MTEQDLHQLRREKWRLDGKASGTIEQAPRLFEAWGFCLMYPVRLDGRCRRLSARMWIGQSLPTWQHA